MKKVVLTAIVLMVSLLLWAKSATDGNRMSSGTGIMIQQAEETLNDNNDFTCNLFRAITRQKQGDSSIIVSPVSVGYMLGMLGQGAKGETRRQITDVLGLGASVKEINMYFKKMTDGVFGVDSTVTIRIANNINVNSALDISLIPKYKSEMLKYYNAQVDALDFTNSSSLDRINNWCDTHTDGMIPKILDQLDPQAVMYLLNAVYFNASWTEKFKPEDTHNKYFTKQDGTILEHKMMHLITETAYGENDLCEMLCLPYGNGTFSMNVLLPRKGKTIDDIIQSLSTQTLEQQREREMTKCKVDILMPRFTAESETDLKKVLSSMGMQLPFNPGAQFTNMVRGNRLWVDMMKQKARIEVNEKGTKAAAVTVSGLIRSTNVNRIKSVAFHATRPFVYYIVDNSTGAIYFMGTYCGEEGEGFPEVTIDYTDVDYDVIVLPEVPVTRMYKGNDALVIPKLSVNRIGKSVEQEPQFRDGEAALMKYLRSHVNYPPMAAESGIEGRVVVQFVVDKTGKVGEVKVVRSADQYLDRETVRVVKSLPKFTPGQQNGQPVDVWYVLAVNFM